MSPPADVSTGERRYIRPRAAGGYGCKTFARPTGATELTIYEAGEFCRVAGVRKPDGDGNPMRRPHWSDVGERAPVVGVLDWGWRRWATQQDAIDDLLQEHLRVQGDPRGPSPRR